MKSDGLSMLVVLTLLSCVAACGGAPDGVPELEQDVNPLLDGDPMGIDPGECQLVCSAQAQAAIANKRVQNSFLGAAQTDPARLEPGGGCFQRFQHGVIFWHPTHGAHEVHGGILNKWAQLGWLTLGYPLTDETPTSDGMGRYNHFVLGSIYWHPSTGAHLIRNQIRAKWDQMGGPGSFLGYPATDETAGQDGTGRYNHFQRGSIFWHPATGAREVHGAIRDKWFNLGGESSSLGYPESDELTAADGVARYTNFQHGSIHWHPQVGCEVARSTMDHGRLYDLSPSLTVGQLKNAVYSDTTLAWFQEKVSEIALDEMGLGLCGDAARNRYGADGAWCSEFVRWVFLQAGMDNIEYEKWWLHWVSLSDVSLTRELVGLFNDNGGRFRWAKYGQIDYDTAAPGDFLALTTMGVHKNHSAIIVAVTFDRQYLWIAQGNSGNCVFLQRIDYFKNGVLNPEIDGIGKLDSGLFGNITSATF